MPKLGPVDWRTLVGVFLRDGFERDREKGSHVILTKPGVSRPVVIPKYAEIDPDIVKANMRTAGMSRQRYFELLGER